MDAKSDDVPLGILFVGENRMWSLGVASCLKEVAPYIGRRIWTRDGGAIKEIVKDFAPSVVVVQDLVDGERLPRDIVACVRELSWNKEHLVYVTGVYGAPTSKAQSYSEVKDLVDSVVSCSDTINTMIDLIGAIRNSCTGSVHIGLPRSGIYRIEKLLFSA